MFNLKEENGLTEKFYNEVVDILNKYGLLEPEYKGGDEVHFWYNLNTYMSISLKLDRNDCLMVLFKYGEKKGGFYKFMRVMDVLEDSKVSYNALERVLDKNLHDFYKKSIKPMESALGKALDSARL